MNAYLVILLVLGIKSQALENANFKEEDCYPLMADDENNRMVLSPPWELSLLDMYKRRCYVYFKERILKRQKESLISSTTEMITTLIPASSKLDSNTMKDNVISSTADVLITTPYVHTPNPTLIPMTTTEIFISRTADDPITTAHVHTPTPTLSPMTATENFVSSTAKDPITSPDVYTSSSTLNQITTTGKYTQDPTTSSDISTGIITTVLISNAAEELQDTTLKGTTLHLMIALCVVVGIIVIAMVAKLTHTRMHSGTSVLKADPV